MYKKIIETLPPQCMPDVINQVTILIMVYQLALIDIILNSSAPEQYGCNLKLQ